MDKLEKKKKDLLELLDMVILMIMLVEKIENFRGDSNYNKTQIKVIVKKVLEMITPIAERDFAIIFKSDQTATNGIIREYENFIAQLRDLNVPQKIILSHIIHAFTIDQSAVEATVHRILKKERKLNGIS